MSKIKEDQDMPEGEGIEVLPEARDLLTDGNRSIWQISLDLVERQERGIEKYGEPLTTDNGRNADLDAYQEILDGMMYMAQSIASDECKPSEHPLWGSYMSLIGIAITLRSRLNKDEIEKTCE